MKTTFAERYKALEGRLRAQAEEDPSVFLPNIPPTAPVDFIFIAMEPSLKWWATSPQDARAQIEASFRNFLFSMEDFLLQFCIKRYLCTGSQTYHLTDLAKGAMTVTTAQKSRSERYDRWYPLLLDEVALVAKTTCTVFAIGRTVEDYLSRKSFEPRPLGLLHYSRQAARYREKVVQKEKKKFERFAETLHLDAVLEVAEETMSEAGLSPEMMTQTLVRLKQGQLTDSRKKLMFTYFVEFTKPR